MPWAKLLELFDWLGLELGELVGEFEPLGLAEGEEELEELGLEDGDELGLAEGDELGAPPVVLYTEEIAQLVTSVSENPPTTK